MDGWRGNRKENTSIATDTHTHTERVLLLNVGQINKKMRNSAEVLLQVLSF
jgi:hypothetical protein